MKLYNAAISAVGAYVPQDVITNKDLEKLVDTNDEWIVTRTGIKERRILKSEGLGTSYIAIQAGKEIFSKTTVTPEEIDLVILTTSTPDYGLSSTASYIATELGCTNAFSFDLNAACSGFLYGLSVASTYIESGRYKNVLVFGADKMSSIIDYTDRATCIIFGDGGGGVLLQRNEEGLGIQSEKMRSDGIGRKLLRVEAGGSMNPATQETVDANKHFVRQDGQQVFKYAVTNMANIAAELLEENNLVNKDIDWLLAHQANIRIIEATRNRLDIEKEKVLVNIHKFGNTTNGTLPLLLGDYENKFKKGDNLLFAAFGGGFTWGAMHMKWAY